MKKIFLATLFATSFINYSQAAQPTGKSGKEVCPCPKLSIDLAKKIINGGELKGYTVFARKALKSGTVNDITSIKELEAYRDSDDNCICEYQALNKEGKEVYNIAAEVHEGINKEPSER